MDIVAVAAHACIQLLVGLSIGSGIDELFGEADCQAIPARVLLECMAQVVVTTCVTYTLMNPQKFIEDPLGGMILGYSLFQTQRTLAGRMQLICPRVRRGVQLLVSGANQDK